MIRGSCKKTEENNYKARNNKLKGHRGIRVVKGG